MTLIEIIIVTVIIALGSAGVTLSLGALSRANLRTGAGRLGAAMHYAYNRAVTQGTTVRVHFKLPGTTFAIEEAHSGVLLTSRKEKKDKSAIGDNGKQVDAIDPWAAAEARIKHPDKPSIGASPFGPLTNADGDPLKRYRMMPLGRGVQIIKFLVANEPHPRTLGEGAVHFFSGGGSENALIQLGDGRGGVYTLEIKALTGRVRIYPEAHETSDLIDDGSEEKTDAQRSEVKEP
jgi:type II secretory pathway pseudopilin PulG